MDTKNCDRQEGSTSHPTAEGIDSLAAAIRNSSWMVFGILFLCILAAIIFRWQVTDNFEGRATVYTGVVNGEPVEPLESLLNRLNDMATKYAVLKELAVDPTSERGALLIQSFKVRAIDTKLELSIRDLTPDGARAALTSFIGSIITDQENQTAEKVSDLKAELSFGKALVASTQENVQNNTKLISRGLQGCIESNEATNKCLLVHFLGAQLAASTNDLRRYRAEVVEIEKKLRPKSIQEFKIESISASSIPVTPSTRHVLVLAVFLGLVIGVGLAVGIEAFRRLRAR